MNILLIYPLCPDSFWSFKHALKFVSKKAAVPPLGLLTVSAMLPSGWQKKLVDLNISILQTSDVQWADYIFISAMYIQRESVNKVIAEGKKWNKIIVAGGPLFTQDYENYPQIDHFILNEAEITMPLFLNDLAEGHPKRIYSTGEYADISQSPVPDYHLLTMKNYALMNLQISRGCPYSCDFCEITALLGHKVRMKETAQVISELDRLYSLHWHGPVSIVDDNFIGNKKVVKNNLLPAMKRWMQIHKYPFVFTCQSSINLADDAELMSLMVETGFDSAFIGIETPEETALQDCNKMQNRNRDLLQNVKKIQKAGLQVSGGFIVGFDSDTSTIFQRQIDFIQQSGIVSAMVGLLNAPKNTKLYAQMEAENRLTIDASGDNTDSSMNFTPKMNYNDLIAGHKRIIQNIYATKPYYKRLRQLLRNFNPQPKSRTKIDFTLLFAFLRSIYVIGFKNSGRGEYWKLMIWTLFNRPGSFIEAITYTVYGFHFQTIYGLRNKR